MRTRSSNVLLKIAGYNISWQSKTKDWLDALERAVDMQFPEGVREKEQSLDFARDGELVEPLFLVSDNGSRPTSVGFMAACNMLGIKQIFASHDNPKGNADTERVIRTIKEDLIWPNEFQMPFELQDELDRWVMDYNTDYPHSSLNYKTPCEYEELCLAKIP